MLVSPKSVALALLLVFGAFLMALAISSPIVSPDGPWLGWLGWVSLAPLFVAIRRLSPWRAMACGSFWGVCLYLFLVGFTPGFDGTVGSLGLLATVPAAYAFGAAHLTRRVGFNPLFLGLGWIGVELALHPLGLASGLLAGTQGHGPVVNWASALLGSGVVAFVVAAANATLVLIVVNLRLRSCQVRFGIPARRRESGLPLTAVYRLLFDLCSARPRAPPA